MPGEAATRRGALIVPAFRDSAWCRRVASAIDRAPWSKGEIADGGYRVNEAVRRVYEVDVDVATLADVEAATGEARQRAEEFFGLRLVRNEGPSVLRYQAGGLYRSHRDCVDDGASDVARVISVVLFLCSAGEAAGGALRLHGAADRLSRTPLDIRPLEGTLVAFPSTWLHEVLPVKAGVRDVVVDWLA